MQAQSKHQLPTSSTKINCPRKTNNTNGEKYQQRSNSSNLSTIIATKPIVPIKPKNIPPILYLQQRFSSSDKIEKLSLPAQQILTKTDNQPSLQSKIKNTQIEKSTRTEVIVNTNIRINESNGSDDDEINVIKEKLNLQNHLEEEMMQQFRTNHEKNLNEKSKKTKNLRTENDLKYLQDSTFEEKIPTEITEKPSLLSQDNPAANSLIYRNGEIISGSLDKLIQHMVPTSDYYPDHSYIFAFLLSARLFIRPYELFERICQLCEEQQNLNVKKLHGNHPIENSSVKNNIKLDILNICDVSNNSTASSVVTPSTIASSSSDTTIQNLRKFAKNFLRLLAEWISIFAYDFRDERLMQYVRLMTSKCISIDNSLHKPASEIVHKLLQNLTVLEKYENFLHSINLSQDTESIATSATTTAESQQHTNINNSYQQFSSGGGSGPILQILNQIEIMEFCPSTTIMSHQLTHIELERLSHIGPEEFVQVFAKENLIQQQNSKASSISDTKKTKNLETYVHWFNRLSYLVASEIVRYSKKKQRVRIVDYWIETAQKCFNIGNFNSLMAIIAGLNMSPILRLKKTWAKVQCAKFSVLEHQMDPSSNFNSYRATLKAAMWRSAGAHDASEKIIIPFFSLLVKDLYFLNEGCSNRLPNGHINFEKFWQLSKQIKEFISWKQVVCPFERYPNIILFLQSSRILNENTLALASFECEQPENHVEKERYKSLKVELLHNNNLVTQLPS